MKSTLARVFDELLREVNANPDLKARIERHLSPPAAGKEASPAATKRKSRRNPPPVDPYIEIKQGEFALREKLVSLTVDQLKDIVSAFALDASRLVLKWKDHARLIDFIITTVRSRLEKGDAFRSDAQLP